MDKRDHLADFVEVPARDRGQEIEGEPPAAWAMIEPGRFQPRRIRGSCLGRELG